MKSELVEAGSHVRSTPPRPANAQVNSSPIHSDEFSHQLQSVALTVEYASSPVGEA